MGGYTGMMGGMDVGTLTAHLTLDDTQFNTKMNQVNSTLNQAGAKMRSAGMALSAAVTLPLVAIGAGSAKAAIDFESSFAGVRKTVDATEEEFQRLAQGFRNMAKEIPVNVNELNRIGEAAGQLGIRTENIEGFTRVMADLGVATNMASDEAATALARLANITQMGQKDFDRLGSVIVDLGNNFATTESEIVQMGLRIAGAGKAIGMSEADIMGFSAALTSVGIQAEMGGSALTRLFIDMAREVDTAGEKLDSFARIAGMTAQEFQQAFKQDAARAIESFIVGLAEVERQGGSTFQALDELGIRNVRMQQTLLNASKAEGLLSQALETGRTAWEENIALTEEANKRYGTTENQLKLAKQRIQDVAITMGQVLLPIIADILEAITPFIEKLGELAEWFKDLPPWIQKASLAIGALAAATGPALIAFGLMAQGITSIVALLPALNAGLATTTGFLAGPAGIVAAMAAAGIGIVALRKHFDDQIEEFKQSEEYANSLKEEFGELEAQMMLNANSTIAWNQELDQLGSNLKDLSEEDWSLSIGGAWTEETAAMRQQYTLMLARHEITQEFYDALLWTLEQENKDAREAAEKLSQGQKDVGKTLIEPIEDTYGTMEEQAAAVIADVEAELLSLIDTNREVGFSIEDIPEYDFGDELPEHLEEMRSNFEKLARPVETMIKEFELLKMAGVDETDILKVYSDEIVRAAKRQTEMGEGLTDLEQGWVANAMQMQRQNADLSESFDGLFDFLEDKLGESEGWFGDWGKYLIGVFKDVAKKSEDALGGFLGSITGKVGKFGISGAIGAAQGGLPGLIGGLAGAPGLVFGSSLAALTSGNSWMQGLGLAGMGLGGLGAVSALGTTGILGGAGYGMGSLATSLLGGPFAPLIAGGLIGLPSLIGWAQGPTTSEAGVKEIARDFGGVKFGAEDYKKYLGMMGTSESESWNYRAQLNRTPVMIQQLTDLAEQQGRMDEFLKSLEASMKPTGSGGWGYNIRPAVEFAQLTGDWEKLDEWFVKLEKEGFGLENLIPDWKEKALITDEFADANDKLTTSLADLRNQLKATVDEADNVFEKFMDTGEITDDLVSEVDRLGGSLDEFTRVSNLKTLNDSLGSMFNTLLDTGEVLPDLRQAFEDFGGDLSTLDIGEDLFGLKDSLDFVHQLGSALEDLSPKLSPLEQILTGQIGEGAIKALEDAGLSVEKFQELSQMISAKESIAGAQPFQALTPELRSALTEFGGERGATAISQYDLGVNTITEDLLSTVLQNINDEFAATIDDALGDVTAAEETIGDQIQSLTEQVTDAFTTVGDNITDAIMDAKSDLVDALDEMLMNLLEGIVPTPEEYAAGAAGAGQEPTYNPEVQQGEQTDWATVIDYIERTYPGVTINDPTIFNWSDVVDQITRAGYEMDMRGGL